MNWNDVKKRRSEFVSHVMGINSDEQDFVDLLIASGNELQEKAEKLDVMSDILKSFFSKNAAQSNLNDYVLCYTTLGKLYDCLEPKVKNDEN